MLQPSSILNHRNKTSVSTKNASFFQPKLSINQPNDVYEQEADNVADKVMRMADNTQEKNFFSAPLIQRKCEACEKEEKEMQRKESNDETAEVSVQTENFISTLSGGKPLGEGKSFFESTMGYDFSDVKIHTNSTANQSAKSINAHAYTHGNNIVFSSNRYQPTTNEGKNC